MSGTHIVSGSAKQITKTAPSRGLSPSRSSPTQRMPSPRNSPAIRPQSPLSPRFDTSGRFETLQPPSPRAMHSRTAGNSQRRANTHSLKLPSLPRFHPANYPSAHSSVSTTPDASNIGSPQPPASPRAHQRVISDAQKHLLFYQREMISVARATSPSQTNNPQSPRLAPIMGSPGPVTPLELEGDDNYLMAGARSAGNNAVESEELMDRLIKEEAARQRRKSNNSPSRPSNR